MVVMGLRRENNGVLLVDMETTNTDRIFLLSRAIDLHCKCVGDDINRLLQNSNLSISVLKHMHFCFELNRKGKSP